MNNLKQRGNYSSTSEQGSYSKVGKLWSDYLNNHPEVRERVESLRRQNGLSSGNPIKGEMTDSIMDVLLMAKHKRITVLEAEVKRLKDQLKLLGGKSYDNI